MTNPAAPVPAVPSLVQELARAGAQKLLTAAATALTGYGVITSDQQAQVVSLGISVVMWAVSLGWSYWQEHHTVDKVKAALAAPAQVVK